MNIDIRDIFKLPNMLSAARILLVPVFVAVFVYESRRADGAAEDGRLSGYIIAAAILILSGLTDALDGMIARHFGLITDLGKILDPVADKLTQAAVVFCLIFRFKELWQLAAALALVIVAREITMLWLGVVFLRQGMSLDGAMWYGKLSTIVFYILVIVLIGAPQLSQKAAAAMFITMTAFAALSFVLYIREYYLMWRARR